MAELIQNLDCFINLYADFEKGINFLLKESQELRRQIAVKDEKLASLETDIKSSRNACCKLTALNKNLHDSLFKQCDVQEKNEKLRKKLNSLKETISNIEKESKSKIEESSKQMKEIRESHRQQLEYHRKKSEEKGKEQDERYSMLLRDMEKLKQDYQEKLWKLENEKQTELVKLRLEYDTKLLKLQNQTSHASNTSQPRIKEEVFRKKLQHVQAQAEKEISLLKKKVAELERLLIEQPNKRKRLYFQTGS